MILGQKIKELAAKRKISQTELAKRLGLNQSAISKIYKKTDISFLLVVRIAKILNYSVNYILKYGKDISNNTDAK